MYAALVDWPDRGSACRSRPRDHPMAGPAGVQRDRLFGQRRRTDGRRRLCPLCRADTLRPGPAFAVRSEEHTSELQSLMRISYAVFCLKKKKNNSIRQTESKLKTE